MKSRTDINNIINLLITLVIIVAAGILLSFKHVRLDLTAEKRFTLSPLTKNVLRNLDDIVYVKVYLDGKLNTPFKRLQIAIRETLEEFQVYGKDNLYFEFINPAEGKSDKHRNEVYYELHEKGLRPVNIKDTDEEGGEVEKIIFPGATIHYKNTEIAVNLLKNNPNIPGDENLNNSRQSLEYELINMIKNITNNKVEKIAFLEGHNELNEIETGDATKELSNFFQVDRGIINGQYGILNDYKAVIIAKPQKPFSEADKFVLDQYIMQGGNVLWFIDAVNVSIDSLYMGNTYAFINDINLQDMFFRYGFRVNPVLVRDMQCNYIPVNTALAGNRPKFTPTAWTYYPLLTPMPSHPVSKKLNLVRSQFANTIDLLGDSSIKKNILLRTTPNTHVVQAPALISLSDINKRTPEMFSNGQQTVAALLEGRFNSAYNNRIINQWLPEKQAFISISPANTKMLVVADGDVIKNDSRETAQGTLISPLSLDTYTRQYFGNKDFVLNAVNYLTGQQELITLRSREFKLRLFDKEKIKAEKKKWQLINTIIPPVLVLLFGLFFYYSRVKHYSHK